MRAYYERSLEQISTLENGKKVTAQQAEFALSERDRLRDEVDKLNKVGLQILFPLLYTITFTLYYMIF